MTISAFARQALCSCVAGVMLTGCGGSQPPIDAPGAMPQTSAVSTLAVHSGSWMRPGARHRNLLYASDNVGSDVEVMTFPEGHHVGTLTNLPSPAGECVDSNGNVFITTTIYSGSSESGTIYEFAHGGTTPIATLADQSSAAAGCAVDPATDTLAVTNFGAPGKAGNVAIYASEQGAPTIISDPNIDAMYFCGYDEDGNLYVDGTGDGMVVLAELPRGSSKFTDLAVVGGNVKTPGAVQWDGHHLAIGSLDGNDDTGAITVYRLTISGNSAFVAGSTQLCNKRCKISGSQFWIESGKIVAPVGYNREVALWRYPSAGKPLRLVRHVGSYLWGVTISPAKS